MESHARAPGQSSDFANPSAARSGEGHTVAAAKDVLHDLVRNRQADGLWIATGPFDDFEDCPPAACYFDQKSGHVRTVAIARTLARAEEDNAAIISLRIGNHFQEVIAARRISDPDASLSATDDVGVAELLPHPLIPGLADHFLKSRIAEAQRTNTPRFPDIDENGRPFAAGALNGINGAHEIASVITPAPVTPTKCC
jgi:hypothetical protein